MATVLEDFGLSPQLQSGVLQAVWGNEASNPDLLSSPSVSLQKWLPLLPPPISQQITLALNQERPFMPPDVTPEMMAEVNSVVPPMNHIEIIYRCIDFALKAKDFKMAAALVYVVDRACYRYGKSAALMHVVDTISHASPDTAIAPQVILRQARVMKDSGDLHNAMRILDAVITKERRWDYKNEEQYENTKAVCVQIKGQILHNLGLWKDAVPPLVESVHSFNVVKDNKGTSSSLALLSRCLKRLELAEYWDLQRSFQGVFLTGHPCYEAYQKGMEAVRLVEDLGVTVYLAHNQMVADESLLMFTIAHQQMTPRQKLDQFQVIVREMRGSLGNHRSLRSLQSLEVCLAFTRALFIISLTLHFSPIPQDADLSRFLEQLSLELYAFVCLQMAERGDSGQTSTTVNHDQYSVRRMNGALALLGLPALEGSAEVEQAAPLKKWSEMETAANSREISSDSAESRSLDSTDSPHQTDRAGQDKPGSEAVQAPVNKAGTFPALTPSKVHGGQRSVSSGQHRLRQKFVGLAMSREDLLSATCPALYSEGGDDVDAPQPPADLDGLVLSADCIPSATAGASLPTPPAPPPSSEEASGSSSSSGAAALKSSSSSDEASLPTPQAPPPSSEEASGWSKASGSSNSSGAAALKSSSSADTPSSSSSSGAKKSTSSATVDRSSSTWAPSSATTDSWEGSSSSNASGLTSSGASGVPPPHSSSSSSGQGSRSSEKRDRSSSDTVDRLVGTEPSSVSDTTDGQDSDLSPLVDVSSACGVMAGLGVGSSVETSDSEEFLAHFVPAPNKDVRRAVLMIYNPLTRLWSAQATLAYQGPQLNTRTKGTHRDAFHISFLHQDEPLGRYVGKRYRGGRRRPEVYMQDVVCQMQAGYYVTSFNQALHHCPLNILQVQFLSAAHLQFVDGEGQVCDWMNVEPYLQGSFLKLTNNLRYVSTADSDQRGVEVATALSHFTHTLTRGALMMVDHQGWTPVGEGGVVYLTDPVFHTRDMKKFSSGDRHQEGMDAFWANQHPRCNRICRFLGLDKTRPDGAGV